MEFYPMVIPDELRQTPQWLMWRKEKRGDKLTKVPYRLDGHRASTTRPADRFTFSAVLQAVGKAHDTGVGFVFTAEDPFVGIDLDKCIDENSQVASEAQAIIDALNSYTEVSPSGRGVKIWVKGRLPWKGKRTKKVGGLEEIECYQSDRYFTVTGNVLPGTNGEIRNAQCELDAIVNRYFVDAEIPKSRTPAKSTASVNVGFQGTDEALLQAIRRSKSRVKFDTLYDDGNLSDHRGDESAADFALVGILAFWCGPDSERIDRLFRGSKLYRAKWDSKRGASTYGEQTICRVLATASGFYTMHGPVAIPGEGKRNGKQTARSGLSNFILKTGEDKKAQKEGLPITDVSDNLFDLTGGWPKRVGNLLFYDDAGAVRFLGSSEALFAWIGERCDLQWGTGSGVGNCQLTPKTEFYAHLQHGAEPFNSVESLPHEPRIATSYYAWRPPSNYTPTGERLAALLQFFDNTESPADRILITAAFLTPAWGGLPGTRPAIAITAPDRGCGKTTLADAIGELYGGICQIQPHGSEENVVSRLLSPDCLLTRVVSIDNIKNGLSSALLESLITTAVISGHRWYHGEARRENNLTWVLTANCLRLSRDLSGRSFFIRLRKPSPIPDWRERLFTFIRENRQEIIADIIHELRRPPYTHTARDRWQSWVDGVLARVTNDPLAVVELNQKRRDEHDDDLEQAADIWDALKIEPSEYSDGFLPSSRVLVIVNRALGVAWKTKTLANVIDGHIEAGRLPGVSRGRKTAGKGYYILRNQQNEQVES